MTYPLNRRLFVENGAAIAAAEARARRSTAEAFYAAEQARLAAERALAAARTVTGAELCIAA